MRRFSAYIFLALFTVFAAQIRAELIWTPGDGWKIEGGALSGLVGSDARNALELMNKARAAEEAGKRRTALRAYKKVTKVYGNSIYSPEAYYRTAHLRLQGRQYYKAFEAFQRIMTLYPNTDRFNEVLGEQYRIAEDLMNGARNYYFGIIPAFRSRERAITYFEWVVANAPYSDYAPLALMNVAKTHQRLDNTPYAIDALDRLINNYAQSLLAPDAYLELAKTHASLVDGPLYDQESTREAITYFEDYMILFSEDEGLAEAQQGLDEMRTVFAESKMILGDYTMKYNKNLRGARVFYNEAITSFPNSAVAARAREKLDIIDAREAELGISSDNDADAARRANTPAPKPKRKKFLGIF
ncbi:tetratricopeptide repeat protein [Synoicihabitans lomoniglobus]|nr:tetratricopeptide repeat protein [Opitutaceae bacterium LMO-M01]